LRTDRFRHTTVAKPQRLEGSRFFILQLHRLAAGGSRERFDVWQFRGPSYPLY
jgi:hypothetical protein